MSKENNITGPNNKVTAESPQEDEFGYSTTVEVHQKTSFGEISTKQHAYLEIIGLEEENKRVELGEDGIIIGRSKRCEVQLKATNVSRRHARIGFHMEDYHIEDMNSTNGTYVNGIRVVKCVLRNHDQIEIGGVKMLFNEEKTLQET